MILKREKQANKFSGNNSLNRSVPPWPSSRSFCFFAKRFNFHWGCQGSEVSERGLCCVNQWTRSKMVCLLFSNLLGHKLWFWVGDKIYVGDDNLAMWDKNRQTSDHFDCHHAGLSWAELGWDCHQWTQTTTSPWSWTLTSVIFALQASAEF